MGITLENVSYIYQNGTPFASTALSDVSLTIKDGSYTALIGHTGSGKSTILQLLNGLLVPTDGEVRVFDTLITPTSVNKEIQFAENQIFEETVLKDVAFGPQNFGVSGEEAETIAREKLALVGIDESLFERSPFELSGGQMRRVAIAGILAMEPRILVLDEPTAGLDPIGRKELMNLFKKLHQDGITIVLVTHLMDDVAEYADQVYVMEKGRLVKSGEPSFVFQDIDFMEKIQLGVPKITRFAQKLIKRGATFKQLPITIEEFKEFING